MALGEGLISARFVLISDALEAEGTRDSRKNALLAELERKLREQQYRAQMETLGEVIRRSSPATKRRGPWPGPWTEFWIG